MADGVNRVGEKELLRAHVYTLLGEPEGGLIATRKDGAEYGTIKGYTARLLSPMSIKKLRDLYTEAAAEGQKGEFEKALYGILYIYGLGTTGYSQVAKALSGVENASEFVANAERAVAAGQKESGVKVTYPSYRVPPPVLNMAGVVEGSRVPGAVGGSMERVEPAPQKQPAAERPEIRANASESRGYTTRLTDNWDIALKVSDEVEKRISRGMKVGITNMIEMLRVTDRTTGHTSYLYLSDLEERERRQKIRELKHDGNMLEEYKGIKVVDVESGKTLSYIIGNERSRKIRILDGNAGQTAALGIVGQRLEVKEGIVNDYIVRGIEITDRKSRGSLSTGDLVAAYGKEQIMIAEKTSSKEEGRAKIVARTKAPNIITAGSVLQTFIRDGGQRIDVDLRFGRNERIPRMETDGHGTLSISMEGGRTYTLRHEEGTFRMRDDTGNLVAEYKIKKNFLGRPKTLAEQTAPPADSPVTLKGVTINERPLTFEPKEVAMKKRERQIS